MSKKLVHKCCSGVFFLINKDSQNIHILAFSASCCLSVPIPSLSLLFKKKECKVRGGCGGLGCYFNLTSPSMQLMDGKVQGRSAREKDSELIQILIEALTILALVVLDVFASASWFILYSQCVPSSNEFTILLLVDFANELTLQYFTGMCFYSCL